MKKLNLTFKITLLFLAFLTCSFIAKTNTNLATNYKKNITKETTIQYTNKVLIMFPIGTTPLQKSQTRSCIASSLGSIINQITPCPNNPNVEVITFSNLRIIIQPTTDIGYEGDDDDEVLEQTVYDSSFKTITEEELHIKIGQCPNIFAHSLNIFDCLGPLPIDPTNIGQ
ncbi:hypothetical protein [uncultured Tenacibaculum sp.]|uniref:hypothetical protein n=1 Tax=uncultured Tenacibaculum sp. TaxID=174713 RepID=UPI00262C18DB|nr:hypothetical protein [uncultured Tenacibaculum sp.]